MHNIYTSYESTFQKQVVNMQSRDVVPAPEFSTYLHIFFKVNG
jgi:hypothetical protein